MATDRTRAEAIDLVASSLLARASHLTRLLLRSGTRELSRTEAGLLTTLLEAPRRVTDLADTEALAQPTVTQLVDRLERRGLVRRSRSAQDGRVVLVSASPRGRELVAATQAQYRGVMRDTMAELTDAELAQLVVASELLGRLIERLRRDGGPA